MRQLADELRAEMIDAVGTTGGHLGSGLGVVELTVAIHYVFDTPTDRLVWDVGHQAYPHKILTGRRDRIRTLAPGRRALSGFTKRSESEYDPFGAAHSLDLDLGRRSASRSPTSSPGTPGKAHRGDRRRRDERGHGLRGDEQRRGGRQPAGGDPQRQRHVDRAAGRRAVGLSRAAGLLAPVPRPARARQAARAQAARAAPPRRAARPTNSPAAWRWAARCSRSWASTTSARSTGTTSTS